MRTRTPRNSTPSKINLVTSRGAVVGGSMIRFLKAFAWLDDHWIGDLIGAVSLFGILWGLAFIGYGLGFK